jgi:hypothetical protein
VVCVVHVLSEERETPFPFRTERKLALNPQHCDAHPGRILISTLDSHLLLNLIREPNPDPQAFGLQDLESSQPTMQ